MMMMMMMIMIIIIIIIIITPEKSSYELGSSGERARSSKRCCYLLYKEAVTLTDPYVPLSSLDTTDCFHQTLSSGLLIQERKIDFIHAGRINPKFQVLNLM